MTHAALHIALGASAALTTAAIGCQPRMPDEAHARATYVAMRATIDPLQDRLERSLSWLHTIDPAATCAPDDAPCTARREADRATFFAERDRWARDVLPTLVRGTPVLGLKVEAQFHNQWAHEIGIAEPYPPGEATGTTPAREGASAVHVEEGRMGPRRDGPWLGWGLYQTAFRSSTGVARGDGRFHRGIEIAWRTTYGLGSNPLPSLTTTFGAVLLEDGFVRPSDW